MRYTFTLENIGWTYNEMPFEKLFKLRPYIGNGQNFMYAGKHLKPWIAVIKGFSPAAGIQREFLKGTVDFGNSNSKGTRGIFTRYHLKDGLYEVNSPTSWKASDRFFCRVADGEMTRLERHEILNYFSSNAHA